MVQNCSSLLLVWLWRHLGWILYPQPSPFHFSNEQTEFCRRSRSDLLGNRIPQCTTWSSAAHWHAYRLSCLWKDMSELITEKCCRVIWSDAIFPILQQRKEVQGSGDATLEASFLTLLWDLSNKPKQFYSKIFSSVTHHTLVINIKNSAKCFGLLNHLQVKYKS